MPINLPSIDIHIFVEPFSFVLDPQKRIFWLYILASVVIAGAVLFANGKTAGFSALKKAVDIKLWLNKSSWLDLQWTIINHVLRVLIVVPVIGGQITVALAVNRSFYTSFGEGNFFQPPLAITAILFTTCLFLFEDFTRFLVHYLYHKVPLLWRFHAIHHSAPTMTPLTLYRIHSIEMFLNSCRSLIVVGSLGGIFMYLFDGAINKTEIMGASIFNFMFNMAGSNLRHSHVWVSFGWFERIFVSPAQHQIHHSTQPEHIDKNFGSSLAIWDRLFGSWVPSKNQIVPSYGIHGREVEQKLSKQLFGLGNLGANANH